MSSSTVDTIKERLGIVEVLSGYMELVKAGSNFKAKCPFHNEKTASFMVSPVRNSYYCFGCSAKGDIFSFVQQFEGLDFPGALRVLAEKAGIPVVYEHPEQKDRRERLYALLETATLFFQDQLSHNEDALDYLKRRGLATETIRSFRLGFAPSSWRSLYEHLKNHTFSDREMEEAGVVKHSEQSIYDRFRGRIIFPIADASGRIVGFSGRIFGEEEKSDTAKYLNSPETVLFNKSRLLFGFDKAKLAIRRFGFSVVVEGQMDLLMCHQAGFGNSVALSGTALSPEQVTQLKRLSGNVILALDADRAGIAASGRSAMTALGFGMDVKIAALPHGKDPAELILEDRASWKECLKNARHVIEFYLEVLSREKPDSRAYRLAVSRIVLPFVARVENRIERAHFVELVARRLGVSEEAVWSELSRMPQTPVAPGANVSDDNAREQIHARPRTRKELLLARLSACRTLAISTSVPFLDAQSVEADIRRIVGDDAFDAWIGMPEHDTEALLFTLENEDSSFEEHRKEYEDLIMSLEEEILKERYARAMEELRFSEGSGDDDRIKEALRVCHELSRQMGKFSGRRHPSQ